MGKGVEWWRFWRSVMGEKTTEEVSCGYIKKGLTNHISRLLLCPWNNKEGLLKAFRQKMGIFRSLF